jgi:hypothetical protein
VETFWKKFLSSSLEWMGEWPSGISRSAVWYRVTKNEKEAAACIFRMIYLNGFP